MTEWKFGCRWGHGKPLSFDLLIKYRIVISSPDKRFAIGDWVLLTDGHTVLGFAEVIGKPLKIADNELLKSELNKRVVNGYPAPIVDNPSLASEFGKRDVPNNVDVYDANVWELAENYQFKYQIRQGIVHIKAKKILGEFNKIRQIYMEKDVIRKLLEINKNIILHGAPGTGKTYQTKGIAALLMGLGMYGNLGDENRKEFETRYKMVQFHPSYDYTDFVEGLRPIKKDDNVGFERKDGIFKSFCKKALKAYNEAVDKANAPKYVFVIDEINRGDMSKIFGELFFSIDPGYRGNDGKVDTQYQNLIDIDPDTSNEDVFKDGFYVPENVYIIGTMNDIDRSVESMDFAIRRRFVFIEITAPESQSMLTLNAFKKINAKNANLAMNMVNEIKSKMDALNAKIISEKIGLSPDYQIGAAYFLNYALYANESNPFDLLWDYHLKNILTEYVRGTGDEGEKMKMLKTAYDNAKAQDNR